MNWQMPLVDIRYQLLASFSSKWGILCPIYVAQLNIVVSLTHLWTTIGHLHDGCKHALSQDVWHVHTDGCRNHSQALALGCDVIQPQQDCAIGTFHLLKQADAFWAISAMHQKRRALRAQLADPCNFAILAPFLSQPLPPTIFFEGWPITSMHLQSVGLAAAFSLPEDATIKFFQSIENGYKDNPYHNR